MELISREEARSKGLHKYYTGVPCSRGHYAERRVGGTFCTACEELKKQGKLEPPKVYTVGYNSAVRGISGYPTRGGDGYKILREYDHWRRMLQRSYDLKWKNLHPTYEECFVNNVWWDYQDFGPWYSSVKYKTDESDLDKDLLMYGNKEYGPETCVFLPEKINKAIVLKGCMASWHNRDDCYEFNCNGKYLGRSESNPLALQDAWMKEKLGHIQNLANFYKDVLDPRAYDALINFKIEVIDEKGTVARLP